MKWKIERHSEHYHVQVYDEDESICLDRDVEDFISACILVDEMRATAKNQIKEVVKDI